MDWQLLTASASALAPLEPSVQQSSVVNLFKLSKDWANAAEAVAEAAPESKNDSSGVSGSNVSQLDAGMDDFAADEDSTAWCDKDLQLWERDKAAVVESLMNRLRSSGESARTREKRIGTKETPSQSKSEAPRDTPDVVMSHELEMLLSWLDRHAHEAAMVSDEARRIFVDNMMPLLSKCDANAHNFVAFMLDLTRLGDPRKPGLLKNYLRVSLTHLQKHAWGSLHLAFLNTKGVFLDSLIAAFNNNPHDVLKTCVECAELVFPSQAASLSADAKPRNSEFYFFIAYLLFRAGSEGGLRLLLGQSEHYDLPAGIDVSHYPALFLELCALLLDVLRDSEHYGNKQALLGKFVAEYFPTKQNNSLTLLGKGSNFYILLLLSVLYPDYYAPCDADALPTKEDYLWYQIHIVLAGSTTSLSMAAAGLCHTLTQEVSTVKAGEPNVLERVFDYAYSIALVGGVMESLRLLMSAIQATRVQAVALVFFVYFENCGLLDADDVKYIARSLWNIDESGYHPSEAPYLTQLAFSRKRNVSPELKILLATILPPQKSVDCMKYVVSESFNEAINICFIGTAATRNGMLVVGPLLQKLIKLATRRSSAKLAILLMAQYSAHVGLWAAAFKCFYCIQDVENCVSVLEACCCYLYDHADQAAASAVTGDDLCVYFSLVKSLSPNNKRLLELAKLFDCIKVSVLEKSGDHAGAVTHAKRHRIFDNVVHVLRNEAHQIYFNALVDFIKALKHMVATGRQPTSMITEPEAHNLVDLLESAYQNPNADKNRTVEAIHMLMTFITIVPPKPGHQAL
ncbi:c-type cytochrome biogenesis protein CcsB [Babesia caballi]|uniref:C-type cytochrome biogenesis protein CcsB n=1 Tax=Babesia caballi TaxID=5871 RepID=A0AAV4LLK3_BABCB|nr:c-type cytochrome biogenesis protein CcsB [Babesia caballi]